MRRTSILTAAAALAGLALVSCSSNRPAPTVPQPPAPTASDSRPSPSQSATSVTPLSSWSQGGGKAFLATLASDVKAVASDDASHDTDSLTTDCIQLTGDVTLAQKYAPAPDPQIQSLWSAALSTLHQGYWDCNGGFSDSNMAEVSKGVAEITSAAGNLTAVASRVS